LLNSKSYEKIKAQRIQEKQKKNSEYKPNCL